jgi:hypothetical protein
MPTMTDTMAALTSLQQALDNRLVMFQRCKLHPDLQELQRLNQGRRIFVRLPSSHFVKIRRTSYPEHGADFFH